MPQRLVPKGLGLRYASNRDAWGLGERRRNGFHIRKVVWGFLMARAERRNGEEIRKVRILVGPVRKPTRSDVLLAKPPEQ